MAVPRPTEVRTPNLAANVPNWNARGERRDWGRTVVDDHGPAWEGTPGSGVWALRFSITVNGVGSHLVFIPSIRGIADRVRRLLAGGRVRPTARELRDPRAQRNL